MEECHSTAQGYAHGKSNFSVLGTWPQGRTFENQGFRVTLTCCHPALSLKEEVLPPAAYSHPLQQHKSYCGHREHPAGRWNQVKINLGEKGGGGGKAKHANNCKPKTPFPRFLYLMHCACTELVQGKEQCVEKEINGERSTGTTSFDGGVNLPLLEVFSLVKLKHNILTLSRVNPVPRGCNTQVTGSRLVWIVGRLCHDTFCLLIIFFFFLLLQMGCFQVSPFRIVGGLSLLAREKTRAAN